MNWGLKIVIGVHIYITHTRAHTHARFVTRNDDKKGGR